MTEQADPSSPLGGGVWVDDQHSVVRRGMVVSLSAAGVLVIGESWHLQPTPGPTTRVLLFDADLVESRARAAALGAHMRLVATLRAPSAAALRELADNGAADILLMDELTPDSLVQAVTAAARGRTTVSSEALRRLLDHAAHRTATSAEALSPRERAVLQMLADGDETRQIAQELNYSERTVKNVVHDLLTKLNCRTRAQAVGTAMRGGIL